MKNQNRTENINASDYAKNEKTEDVFTDEEVKALEKELIHTYLATGDKPIKILLGMYKKYVKEITLSLFFFFIKTLLVMVLPIMSARIINLVSSNLVCVSFPEQSVPSITIIFPAILTLPNYF